MGWLDDLFGSLGDAASSGDWGDSISEVATSDLPSYFDSGAGLLDSVSGSADYSGLAGDSISSILDNYTPTSSYSVPETSWLDTISAIPETSYYSTSNSLEVPSADISKYFTDNAINSTTNMPSYATDSAYTNASGPSIMDTLDKYGTMLSSPGGKLLTGLGGAGLSAYGALKQNALAKAAQKKQAQLLAARQAASNLYSAPLRLSNPRQATDPTSRNGESTFFSNNRIPSYFAQGGRTGPLQSCNCGGGAIGYVKGGSPGQADKINAKVSDGEYVMDADVVSALGDGNNEAGAAKLDSMRKGIREHKRSAPATKIPPKAKSPLEYMKKSKGAK